MLDQTGMTRIPYEEVMLAIGYFMDQNSLREICIVELKEGLLVRGIAYTAERSGFQTMSESYLFTHDDIERIVNESYQRRKAAQDAAVQAALLQYQNQNKGGIFGR